MIVKEILKAWLKDSGFQGLYNPYVRCGCSIEDLNPCEDCAMECKPAYITACKKDCSNPCDSYGDENCTQCFTTEKPDHLTDVVADERLN